MRTNWRWGMAAVAVLTLLGGATASGQAVMVKTAATVPVLMLSDIHFDPFRDPGKTPELARSPAEEWDRILKEPDTGDKVASYAALETACKPRGEDTDIALLTSVLKGAKEQADGARFVTLSGDLLVHQFECRYHAVMKGDEEGYAGFAEKTAMYVMQRVQAEFPRVPVYASLGNNDSGCGDYKMDVRDQFLAATSGTVLNGLKGASKVETSKARESYERGGYYAVSLPGAARTRLLVLNDLYLSNKYAGCEGRKGNAGASEQMAWLKAELELARVERRKVWVMGHIPPGVDVYSTLRHVRTMCTAAPERFLSTDELASVLEQYGDVIRLALFGHTHTDEFRVVGEVPVKLVGSVTPINGNAPSFTVGQVNSASAVLKDYAIFTSSNTSGVGTAWTREYSFGEAYTQPDFSAKSLRSLIANFRADPNGAKSAEYERDFFGGDGSPLPLVWPQYVCALDHAGAAAFHDCMCPAQ